MSDQSMIKSFSMREEFLTVCMYVPTVKSVLTYQTFTSCGVSAHAPDATKSEQEKKSYLLCIQVSLSAKCWCFALLSTSKKTYGSIFCKTYSDAVMFEKGNLTKVAQQISTLLSLYLIIRICFRRLSVDVF